MALSGLADRTDCRQINDNREGASGIMSSHSHFGRHSRALAAAGQSLKSQRYPRSIRPGLSVIDDDVGWTGADRLSYCRKGHVAAHWRRLRRRRILPTFSQEGRTCSIRQWSPTTHIRAIRMTEDPLVPDSCRVEHTRQMIKECSSWRSEIFGMPTVRRRNDVKGRNGLA